MRRLTQRLLAIIVVLGFCGLIATAAQAATGTSPQGAALHRAAPAVAPAP